MQFIGPSKYLFCGLKLNRFPLVHLKLQDYLFYTNDVILDYCLGAKKGTEGFNPFNGRDWYFSPLGNECVLGKWGYLIGGRDCPQAPLP